MTFNFWDWVLTGFASLLIGVAKTGITGISLLFVSMFASAMPAKRSTGVVLPLLILGDVVAVITYRRHAQWKHLWRLFPWAATGVILGYFAMSRMNDGQVRVAIGIIVLGLVVLHGFMRRRAVVSEDEHAAWFAPLIGILAGFATILSNAAGPLMVIYLLAMRLPKMEYLGTGAVFFLVLNLFKVPFMVALGLVNRESLMLNLALAPAVLAGTWLGRWIVGRINQRLFENIALALTVAAGVKMLF